MSADNSIVMATIFLERPAMPNMARLKEKFGDVLGIRELRSVDGNAAVQPLDDGLLTVMLMDFPLPEPHWKDLTATAWWWPEAAAQMRKNGAHLIVSKSANAERRLDDHLKLTLIVREFIDQLPAIGVAWASVLMSADNFAGEFHRLQTEQRIPIRLWVLIQMSQHERGGTIVSTLGMDKFGLMEIEANPAPMEMKDSLEFVENIATYLINSGPVIKDGDTIGGTEDQRIRVRHAPSFREGPGTVYLLDFGLPGEPKPEASPGFLGRLFGRRH